VPKTANRLSSQTIFLLAHNKERCVERMSSKLLAAMGKIVARHRQTVSKNSKFLDKVLSFYRINPGSSVEHAQQPDLLFTHA
jgi:hypothetical protein